MAGIKIIGLGKAQGSRVVTNDDLAEIVDTNDAWIREKTGIQSRFFAEGQTNEDMAVSAAEKAIAQAGINREDISMMFVCTFTPDDFTPAVACGVLGRLGLKETTLAVDLNGACSGFIYGCNIANGMLAAQKGGYALVIGSEKISPLMDMSDRATCVLFGDGAGAAVLAYDEDAQFTYYGGCASNHDILYCGKDGECIQMAGQEVYRFAVSKVPECINKVLSLANLTDKDIDYFVCHQANERIIDNAARRISKDKEKFFKNLYRYGNTSAASIPIALTEMNDEGLLKSGTKLICTGFGAGLTYGSMFIEI
ncbi:3-oxoacyl-[acyl-carrier-protein] synthase-3 [Clostridiales Family XIII bacterium PM5-7]